MLWGKAMAGGAGLSERVCWDFARFLGNGTEEQRRGECLGINGTRWRSPSQNKAGVQSCRVPRPPVAWQEREEKERRDGYVYTSSSISAHVEHKNEPHTTRKGRLGGRNASAKMRSAHPNFHGDVGRLFECPKSSLAHLPAFGVQQLPGPPGHPNRRDTCSAPCLGLSRTPAYPESTGLSSSAPQHAHGLRSNTDQLPKR